MEIFSDCGKFGIRVPDCMVEYYKGDPLFNKMIKDIQVSLNIADHTLFSKEDKLSECGIEISGKGYTYTQLGDVIRYTSQAIIYEKVGDLEHVEVLNENLSLDEVVGLVIDLRWQQERLEDE